MNDNIFTFSLDSYNLPAITIELMEVGPELAHEWLGRNTKNRNLRPSNISKYARDMEAKQWTIDGSTIVFSIGGTLLDGQHRLHAIVASGATVPALVVRGVQDKAQRTIDGGAKRTMGDRLRIDDVPSTNRSVLAALLRRAVMWDRGYYTNAGTGTPTPAEMYSYLDENPGAMWSADFAAGAKNRILAPCSVVALAHWVMSRISSTDADWFFSRLVEPADVPSGHPIFILDNRLKSMSKRTGRTAETEILVMFIRAWNAHREGRKASVFLMPKGGLKNSNFPLPK